MKKFQDPDPNPKWKASRIQLKMKGSSFRIRFSDPDPHQKEKGTNIRDPDLLQKRTLTRN